MKFTDSPVIELKVRDKTLAIEQDNGSMHVGTSVWSCSLVLVKFLERWLLSNASTSFSSSSTTPSTTPKPYADLLNFSGKKAIELGCGCGPAGMGLFLLGLDNIILTDITPVMPALKRNLKRNKPVLGKNLKISQLYWNNLNQIKTLNPPFDFVIAADVVYIEESVGHLVSAMESLVSDIGFILLGYQIRSPEAHKLFWELCENVFLIEKVPHEDLHPEYAYEEADVYVMKKKMTN